MALLLDSNVSRLWVVNNTNTIAVSVLPKNGSHSISSFFKGERVTNKEVISCPLRIVFLRNPTVKLISLYSFFKEKTEKGLYKGRPNKNETSSYERFIDFILNDRVIDSHWGSQVEQLTLDGEYLGTVTHKFENIHRHWGRYIKGMLPHLNGCVHYPVNIDYRFTEIKKMYFKDFNLYNSLED